MDCWPLAESPRSYILLSAMSLLGACIGRKAFFMDDRRHMFPMLNLLLIGPSGIGKSTSLDFAVENLLPSLPKVDAPEIMGPGTPEKMHSDLSVRPKALLVASELAAVFSKSKYMEGMIPYVTRLLDYPKELTRNTKGSSLEVVKEPSVTVVGGSTRDWLQDQLPDSAASGGFLARFLIIKEEHKFQRTCDPPERILGARKYAELEAMREDVFSQFGLLVEGVGGRIDYKDYEASDTFSLWYQSHTPETGYLSPFSARSREMIPRLSMLIAVSCGRSHITSSDVKGAIGIFNYSIGKLQEVIVPVSHSGKLIAQVLQMLGHGQSMAGWEIKRALRNSAPAQEVEKIIESLLQSHDITPLPNGRYQRAGK